MLVRDVMTSDVATVTEGVSLHEAAQILVAKRVSGLPVVDHDLRVVGVISEADFVKAAGHSGALRELLVRVLSKGAAPDIGLRHATVGAVMTSPARTIEPDRPISEAASKMARWKVNRLPVTENGRLVGIVSRADIVGLYARSDGELLRAVSDALSAIDGVKVTAVHEGVATIEGIVDHQATAEAARLIAGQVEGIVGVDDSSLNSRKGLGRN